MWPTRHFHVKVAQPPMDVEQFPSYCYGETGPVRVKFQEQALEIKRRPVQSFADVESPLIRKVRE